MLKWVISKRYGSDDNCLASILLCIHLPVSLDSGIWHANVLICRHPLPLALLLLLHVAGLILGDSVRQLKAFTYAISFKSIFLLHLRFISVRQCGDPGV